jgi:hypothetical protein
MIWSDGVGVFSTLLFGANVPRGEVQELWKQVALTSTFKKYFLVYIFSLKNMIFKR